MGGTKVTPKTEAFIVATLYVLRKASDHGEPTAGEVLAAADIRQDRENNKGIFLPKLRKVQDILKDVRKRESEPPKEQQVQHGLWDMRSLDYFPLPSQSIPSVLQVWRYSTNLDEPFTIRQAKWTARLCFHITDVAELWLASRRYATEEELSLLSGHPMNSYLLDSRLVMGDWELETTLGTDVLDPRAPRNIQHTLTPLADHGGIAEELLHAITEQPPWEPQEESQAKRDFALTSLISQLPSSTTYFPDFEARMVYLRHLSYLAKGPKWTTLPPRQIRSVVVALRQWVTDTRAKIDQPAPADDADYTFSFITRAMTNQQFPLHIYNRVGYNF